MSRAGPLEGRGAAGAIPVLSAANFVIGMGAFAVIGLQEPMAADLGITPAAAGLVLTSYALAYAVLSPLLVAVTGRVGRRRVLAGGLSLFAVAALASALAPTEAALHVARIAAAAGAGVVTPVAAAVGAGLAAPERRGRALAAVFFGLTLAQVLGVPAGGWIAYTFGWRWAFVIVAALALPCIFAILTRVPAGLGFQSVALRDLAGALRDLGLMLAVSFTASLLAAKYIVYTYLGPLLSESMGYGRDGVTAALLVMGLGAVGGNLLGGLLADRLGPYRTLVILTILQIFLLPVFSALPFGAPALFALILIWSTCGWSFLAGQQLRLLALAPERASVVLSLNAAAIYLGAAAGASFGSGALALFGLGALGLAGGAAALFALGHLLFSYRIAPAARGGRISG